MQEATRDKRGQGSRFFFDGDTPLPKTLGNDFLLNSQNKNDLNEFLAQKFIQLHNTPNILIVTYRDTVLVSSNSKLLSLDIQGISINDCQSEEADQRIVRHTLHCLFDCYQFKQVIIHTIDTDVLMLIVSNIGSLNVTPKADIYVKMLKNQNFYNIKDITSFIGLTICKALPFFYSFSGCDTTSSFFKRGKCKIWDTWHNSRHKDEITSVFTKLSDQPPLITDIEMNILEQFVIEIYSVSKSFKYTSLGEMRLQKFITSTDNNLRNLPPSRDALLQHAKSAVRVIKQDIYGERRSQMLNYRTQQSGDGKEVLMLLYSHYG